MPKVANPRKVFNFRVEVAGIDQFEVQKVTLPEIEIEGVEHGDVNYKVKTPGMVTVGDMTFEKLKRLPGSDTDMWDWLNQAQNITTGGGLLGLDYKRNVVIKEMDSTGTNTVNSYVCTGCWVKKIANSDFDRQGSDNSIETVTLSVDTIEKV